MQPQEYYSDIGKVKAAGVKVVRDIPLRSFTDGDQDDITNLTRRTGLFIGFDFKLNAF
jgi:hypothetical protein